MHPQELRHAWHTKSGDTFSVTTKDGRRFDADLVVHGAGRSADIEDLNLKAAGVESTKRGVTVNEKMVTANAHIFAVGDCAATIQLARVADAEAQVAAAGIVSLHKGDPHEAAMDYTAVPSVLFTYPQYGMVGATEEALQKAGVAYKKSVGKNLSWPTYRRVGMKSAAYKVLANDMGQLLGAHVLSDNTAGLINTCTLAMVNHIPVDTLYRQSVMTPYPSRESDIIYMLRPLIT